MATNPIRPTPPPPPGFVLDTAPPPGFILDSEMRIETEAPKSQEYQKPPTFGQKILGAGKEAGEALLGFGESLISAPSAMAAFLPSVAGGFGTLALGKGYEKATETQQKIASFLIHEPKTKWGKFYTKAALSPFQIFGVIEDTLAETLAPNEPGTQAMIRSAFQTALAASPLLKGYINDAVITEKPILTNTIKNIVKKSKAVTPEVKEVFAKVPDIEIPKAGIEYEAKKPLRQITYEEWQRSGLSAEEVKAKRDLQWEIDKREWLERGGKLSEPGKEQLRRDREEYESKYGGGPVEPSGKIAAGQLAYGQKLPETTAGPRIDPLTGRPIKYTLEDVKIGLDRIINPELTLEKAGEPIYGIKKTLLELVDVYKETRAERGLNEPRGWESTELKTMKQDIAKSYGIEDMAKKLNIKSNDLDALTDLVHDAFIQVGERIKAAEETYRANPTEANALRLTTEKARGLSVISAWKEAGTEQARALNIRRKMAEAEDYIRLNDYAKARKILGSEISPAAQWALDRLDISNPIAVAKFMKDWKPISGWDAAYELWINGILSNPSTHMANIVGNSIALASAPLEAAIAPVYELIRAPLTKTPRGRFFGELPAGTIGAIKSFVDPAKLAKVGFEHGIIDGVRSAIKAFLDYVPSETGKAMEVQRGTIFKGKIGGAIRPITPGNVLTIADQGFKAIIYNATKYQLAYRLAALEKNRGPMLLKKTAEYIQNPTEIIRVAAKKEAVYRTFNEQLGKFGSSLMTLRREVKPLGFFLPFIRTPGNIIKFAAERTPLGLLKFTKIGEKALGREAISFKAPEASDVLARVTIGTATAIPIMYYAAKGMITGSGTFIPKPERDKLYAQGWKPYSLHIGDKYISYSRLDPLSHIITFCADWVEMSKYREKLLDNEQQTGMAFNVSLSIGKNLLNKTYMRGLFDIISALEDPVRGERIVANLLTSVIPAGVGATARAIDPTMRYTKPETRDPFLREAEATLNVAKSKIPFLSKELPPQYDIRGEEIKREGGPLMQMISPITLSKGKADPVMQELINTGLSYGFPTKRFGPTKVGRDINQEQAEFTWDIVNRQIGQMLRSPEYARLPIKKRQEILKSLISKARAMARNYIVKKYKIKTK